MNQFKGIIFDIDGTLTSTNDLIFASFNYITKKYLGKTFSNEEIVKWFGPTEDVILKEFCGDNYEKAREVLRSVWPEADARDSSGNRGSSSNCSRRKGGPLRRSSQRAWAEPTMPASRKPVG